VRVGSLFSGCGGLDLGLEAAGFEIAWAAEIDPACRRVLARRRPGLDVLEDVRHVDDWLPEVDVLAGGFPCQDLSYAGRGDGLDGSRSSLWFAFADCVRLLRPRFVLVENVPGLATRGLGRVLYDLADSGYVGRWLRLRAADIGAPHLRERIFIFASAADAGRERLDWPGGRDEGGPAGTEREPDRRRGASGSRSSATDWGIYAAAGERWERILGRPAPRPVDDRGRLTPGFVEWMLGFPDGWTEGESRTTRLRMLGNSVQVQCGELAGRILLGRDTLPGSEIDGAAAAASSVSMTADAGRSKGRPVVVPGSQATARSGTIPTAVNE